MNGWEKLGEAVVLQAAADYRAAHRRLIDAPQSRSAQKTAAEVEAFFCSEDFARWKLLDGKSLMKKLKEET